MRCGSFYLKACWCLTSGNFPKKYSAGSRIVSHRLSESHDRKNSDMSKVEDLQKKIYESDADEELKKRMQYREHFPEILRRPQTSWGESAPKLPPRKQSFFDRNLFLLMLGGFVLVLIIGM